MLHRNCGGAVIVDPRVIHTYCIPGEGPTRYYGLKCSKCGERIESVTQVVVGDDSAITP